MVDRFLSAAQKKAQQAPLRTSAARSGAADTVRDNKEDLRAPAPRFQSAVQGKKLVSGAAAIEEARVANPLVGDKFVNVSRQTQNFKPQTSQEITQQGAVSRLGEVQKQRQETAGMAQRRQQEEESTALAEFAKSELGIDLGNLAGGIGSAHDQETGARITTTSSTDPEIARLEEEAFATGGRGLRTDKLEAIKKLASERFKSSQTGQDFEASKQERQVAGQQEQAGLMAELDEQLKNIGLSLATADERTITDVFERNETFTRNQEDIRADRARANSELLKAQTNEIFNNDKSILDAQKTKEARRLTAQSEKRRKEATSQLNSNHMLTTDASGNLSTDAIALLQTINEDIDDDLNESLENLDERYGTSIIKLQSARSKSQFDIDADLFETEDGILKDRTDRDAAFANLQLEEQFDIRAETREEARDLKTAEKDESTALMKNFRAAQSAGFTGDILEFNDRLQGRDSSNDDQLRKSSEELLNEAPFVYGIPTKLIDSDKEKESFVGIVRAFTAEGKAEGLSPLEIRQNIRDAVLGFTFTDDKNKFRGRPLQNILFGLTDIDSIDFQKTGTLIRRGQFGDAVEKTERLALGSIQGGKGLEGKRYFEKSLLQTDRALSLLEDVQKLEEEEGKKLIGPMSKRLTTGELWQSENDSSLSKETRNKVTKLRSAMKEVFVEWTTRNAGTAKTVDELEFLADILSDTTDQSDVIKSKLEEFKNSGSIQYNILRDSVGLPELNQEEIINKESKLEIYQNMADVAELDDIQKRGGSRQDSTRGNRTIPKEVSSDRSFLKETESVASRLGVSNEDLMTAMGIETAGTFDPSIRNPQEGQTATGLIQFTEQTAKALGTTTEALSKMNRTEQMEFVEKYFSDKGIWGGDLGDVYMAIAQPAHLGKPDDFVIAVPGSNVFKLNPGWVENNKITAGSIRRFAEKSRGKFDIKADNGTSPEEIFFPEDLLNISF